MAHHQSHGLNKAAAPFAPFEGKGQKPIADSAAHPKVNHPAKPNHKNHFHSTPGTNATSIDSASNRHHHHQQPPAKSSKSSHSHHPYPRPSPRPSNNATQSNFSAGPPPEMIRAQQTSHGGTFMTMSFAEGAMVNGVRVPKSSAGSWAVPGGSSGEWVSHPALAAAFEAGGRGNKCNY